MEPDQILDWLTEHGLTVLLILLFAFVAYQTLRVATRTLKPRIQALDKVEDSELDRRTETIFRIIHSTGVVLIVGTALLMILTELNISIAPLLTSIGIVSLALGLGAQSLVQDVVSGIFILLENQYTVGDVVKFNDIIGTIEEMTLRTTQVRDLSGVLHLIPNGEIRIVSNYTRDWSRAIVDVSVTYAENVAEALATLRQIGTDLFEDEEWGRYCMEVPVVTGVEGLDDWAVRLRIMVKTDPGQQWAVQRQLRQQIHHTFIERGIDIAFPRQDVMLVPTPTPAE